MTIEHTLSIIKPDATKRQLTQTINKLIESVGLSIIAQKTLHLTLEQAEEFYEIHKARPFFGDLCLFMTSGEVVVQVLEGESAVQKYRDIMGATNPAEAEQGTIRALHGESLEANSVHGSDSLENAKTEIQFFFGDELTIK